MERLVQQFSTEINSEEFHAELVFAWNLLKRVGKLLVWGVMIVGLFSYILVKEGNNYITQLLTNLGVYKLLEEIGFCEKVNSLMEQIPHIEKISAFIEGFKKGLVKGDDNKLSL